MLLISRLFRSFARKAVRGLIASDADVRSDVYYADETRRPRGV